MSTAMGPIRISPNGRYFADQDGVPFFWLGDTQWELFRLFTIEDAEAVLENRKSKGFSVIQIMITGVGDGTEPDLAGQAPWIDNDPAAPNEAYFENVDKVIELGMQKGLIFVLGVYHQLQQRITIGNARNYAKWIAQRYSKVPNIIWTMYPRAEQEYIPLCRELAAGLQEGDEGFHLITVHPDPAIASSSFIHNESWLSFNMIQTWNHYETIYRTVTADYALIPAKPAVMAEGGYEGVESNRLQTPLAIRKQAYWSHLAGGHYSYGHNDNWASPASWKSWIDSPGSFHLGVYKDIITYCHEWWNWVPDQSIIASGENSGLKLNVAARSINGNWIVVYLSCNTTISIETDRIDSEKIKASWADPTTGLRTEMGNFDNEGIRSFSTPEGWDDAVLILESII